MSIFAERTEKNDKLMNEKEFFHVVMVYEQMPGTYNMYRWGIDSIFSTKEAAKRYIDTGKPDSDFDENEEEHLDDLDYWMRNYDCELYRGCLVVKRGFDDRPCYDGIWEVRFDEEGNPCHVYFWDDCSFTKGGVVIAGCCYVRANDRDEAIERARLMLLDIGT